MEIKQFEDKSLAHYSYALLSENEIALVDPARNPQPYYDFAEQHNAKIVAVIETHPHADFVSSHLEVHNTTGAVIYASKLLDAEYPHKGFDEGQEIKIGKATLKALNTPGHSPDSISIVAVDESGKEHAVFTGDTLFIGDCGRPDLREKAGAITAAREQLARDMYHSLRDKLMTLPDHVLVYPAHGAGSLCGKGLSSQNSSTIGAEKVSNWSLQKMSEEDFIKELLADQPFIPKYFPEDVGMNKKGAEPYESAVNDVKISDDVNSIDSNLLIVDTRPQEEFKAGHLKNSVNLMNDTKFETWLGSIINPGERFYLLGKSKSELEKLISRVASIGYENQIAQAIVYSGGGEQKTPGFDSEELKNNPDAYTILDIRNASEVKSEKIFDKAIHIPLHELRERADEVPAGKPVVVHCAGGYRSAAGSSILEMEMGDKAEVYDLSEAIKKFRS